MKSRYLACSIALLALVSVSTDAIAQSASVPARRLFLYDGGTAVTLNRITLESPDATTLTGNYGLILPPQQGNVNDIMYVQSNSGSNNVLNFTNGSPLFWRVVGNDHAIIDGTNNLMGTLTDDRVRFMTNGTTTVNVSLLVMGNSADNYNFGMGNGVLPATDAKLLISNIGEAGLTTGLRVNSNNIGIEIAATDAGISIGGVTAPLNGIELRGATAVGILVGGFGGGTTPAVAVSAEGTNRAFQAVNSPVSFDGDGSSEFGDDNADVHDVFGQFNVNSLAGRTATTTIGQTTDGGAVTINTSTTNPLTLDVGINTNNLVLNNILNAAITDDLLWITGANEVRRVTASNTADEGVVFTTGAYRLGSTVVGTGAGANPFLVNRTVNLDNFSLTFNRGAGADAMLTIDAATDDLSADVVTATILGSTSVGINTSGAGTTTIGSAAAGAISLESLTTITATAGTTLDLNAADIDADASATIDLTAGTTLAATGGTGATITATTNNLVLDATAGNLDGTGNTGVNLTATTNNVTIGATAGQVILNSGTDVDINATGNVTVDGVNITETATTAYSLSAPTADINTGIASTTNIGNTTNGIVNVFGNGNNGITITGAQAAPGDNTIVMEIGNTTSNMVINNILASAITDDLLWITGANEVRRISAASTADEGVVFTTGAYRLGSTVVGTGAGANPFLVNRTVNLDNFSLTINRGAGADAMLTIDAATDDLSADVVTATILGSTSVGINTSGAGTTTIGSAAAGAISLESLTTITATAGTTLDLNAADIDADASATIDLAAGTTFAATGGTGATITATTNNLVLDATAGNLDGTGNTGVNLTATTNNVTIGATAGQVILNSGTDVDINATGNVTVDGVNITETATTAYSLSAPTADINTGIASTTNIGNTTNGIVNVSGNGNNGVTITGAQAAPGNNTIVMEVGNDASNLVINNLAVVNPIEDLLWINAANQVRRTPFSGTANEGLMFQTSAYRLGANAIDVNPIISNRIVTVGALGTLSFQTAAGAQNMLQLNNNGNVAISSVGAGTTSIGSVAAGNISLIAGSALSDVYVEANDMITTVSGGNSVHSAGGTYTITGTTGASVTATTNNLTLAATAGQVNANAGTTFSATGATGATVTATTNNAAINATVGQVNATAGTTINATGGTGVNATATTGNVTIGATVGQVELNANSATGAVNINATNAAGTIALTAGNTVGVTSTGNDVNITVPGATSGNDLRLIGIDADATPTHMLTHTGTNEVRRTSLAGAALEGIVWSTGAFRLGTPTAGNGAGTNPFLVDRFVNLDAQTITFNRGAAADAMLVLNGSTDDVAINAATVGLLGTTSINTSGTGTTTIGSVATGGVVTIESATTITATANTSLSLNGTTTATVTGGTGASLVATTGAAAVTASAGNATVTATGVGNDVVLTAPDVVQVVATSLVVDTDVNPNLTITEAGLDRGANQITVGATTGTLLLNGASGSVNITAPSLAADVLPVFVHPTDGIVIANGAGVLRRRPITDLINANQGLTYNEAASAEVRLGSTTDGTNAITTSRFVRVDAPGTLTFTHAGGNMLQLNNNGDVNINTTGAGNTAIGNAAGTFGVTSNRFRVDATNGALSNANGTDPLQVLDPHGLLVTGTDGVRVNTDGVPGGSDLVITETTLSRVGNININPGAGAAVLTDGSLNVAGSTQLGDGVGSDPITMNAGPANISMSTSGIGLVDIITGSSGSVRIQPSGNGDVVIGNNPAENVVTINAEVRGAGANRFAERVTIAGTGVAAYAIANTLVQAGSVIIVTVENYTGVGILGYEITNRTAGTNFEITFSAAVLALQNVTINYMIINP